MKLKVSLICDDQTTRDSLCEVVITFKEVSMIDSYNHYKEFINGSVDSDVLLLHADESMREPCKVVSWLKNNKPRIKIIIISNNFNPDIVKRSVQNGANGFLLNSVSKNELNSSINNVFLNRFHINEYFTYDLILTHSNHLNELGNEVFIRENAELTEREIEVTKLICNQLTYKEIAGELGISQRTVESHKKNILTKIGATKVTGIVVFAIKKGWI